LEGFGLVNIEANAMGTPVVAYKSQGLVDSVVEGKSGEFCEENTPVSMARLIIELLKNRRKLDELSLSSVSWSKNFDWKKSKAKSLDLIEIKA